jgi:hypothetical protein
LLSGAKREDIIMKSAVRYNVIRLAALKCQLLLFHLSSGQNIQWEPSSTGPSSSSARIGDSDISATNYDHWIRPLSFEATSASDRWSDRVDINGGGGGFLTEDALFDYFDTEDELHVHPREILPGALPSTPHLNAIMDKAMAKVKALLYELEMDRDTM